MRNLWAALVAATLIGFGAPAIAEPVNINTASAEELAENLTGVGEARARAIVAYRKANGPFKRVEDLEAVEGIGSHIVELNRDSLLLTDPGSS